MSRAAAVKTATRRSPWVSRLAIPVLHGCVLLIAVALVALAVQHLLSGPDGQDPARSREVATLLDIGRSLRQDVRRVVQPAIDRVQKIASDPEIIARLRDGGPVDDLCNDAIRASTEIDAVVLFNRAGHAIGLNTIYASGEPIPQERIDRILRADYSARDIIRQCIDNDASEPVLEFQTTCDITPALFDSSGLSVAYSAPVMDPDSGERVGVISARLRFERLSELIEHRAIANVHRGVEFVTDEGGYFSESINTGRSDPPVPASALKELVLPLTRGESDFRFARVGDNFVGLFRLHWLRTIQGGGIQVMFTLPADWLEAASRWERLMWSGERLVAGVLLALLVALHRSVIAHRRSAQLAKAARARAESAIGELSTYRVALDQHSIVAITDARGVIVDVNDAFCRISQYSRAELLGNNHRIINSGRHPKAFWTSMYRTISAGRIWHGEICNRAKDGSFYWVDTSIVPFRNPDGSIARFVAIRTDVTDRKLLETSLTDERAQLAAFVEHAPAALAMLDKDLNYIAASNRWLVDFGMTGQSIVGRAHYEVFPYIPEAWKRVHQSALAGSVERNEHDIWSPPSPATPMHLKWEVRPWYSASGRNGDERCIGGIMIYAEDLTTTLSLQAKASEASEQLEMALDAGGLASWDWNLATGFISFDQRLAAQLGLKPHELSPHASEWLQRLHPDDAPLALAAAQDHIANRTPLYESEHRVRHADGTWRWILDRGRVVARAEDGTALRMVGMHTDITDRKVAEGRLAQAQRLESIGQLAAGLAHEINTPIQYV